MKDVCKEAAKAVQETKNIKELPADLQAFLEWLISANSQETSKPAEYKLRLHDDLLDEDYLEKYDKTDHILDLATSNEKDIHIDPRSECLGTIHAIQTLMEQYNEMNDENKSKMTGVKQYLESQLEFLNKQLTLYDSLPNLYSNQAPIRFRRDITKNNQHDNHERNQIKHRLNRKLRKYIKSFGIKHTKTTVSHFEAAQITEPSKVDKNNINNLVENENHINSERLNKKPVEFKKNELKHMNSESSNINIDNDEDKNKNNVDFKNVAKTDEVKKKLPNVYFKALNEVKLDAHESGQKN
ncbi:uncharacterized protein LOC131852197 [Achroia grisella]|uniref:uncharacterized protein LOC131852197 n=1 Tax=Achroia grisella TaxID=688607 RepID=UPI0027D288B5|nr:uncharacterized protein LOC131852197 [Achroia grisella]